MRGCGSENRDGMPVWISEERIVVEALDMWILDEDCP